MAKKNKNQPTIEIKFNGLDVPNLVISKVTEVDIEKGAIYFEQLPDGKWRMTYTKNIIPDMAALQSLEIVRGKLND